MLEYAHAQDLSHICYWESDGKGFVIEDTDAWLHVLGCKFFPHQSSFRSFERQLNIWGFLRKKRQKELEDRVQGPSYSFFHEHFIRRQPHCIKNIVRKADTTRSFRRFNGIRVNQNLPSDDAKIQQQQALRFLDVQHHQEQKSGSSSPSASWAYNSSRPSGLAPEQTMAQTHMNWRNPTPPVATVTTHLALQRTNNRLVLYSLQKPDGIPSGMYHCPSFEANVASDHPGVAKFKSTHFLHGPLPVLGMGHGKPFRVPAMSFGCWTGCKP